MVVRKVLDQEDAARIVLSNAVLIADSCGDLLLHLLGVGYLFGFNFDVLVQIKNAARDLLVQSRPINSRNANQLRLVDLDELVVVYDGQLLSIGDV